MTMGISRRLVLLPVTMLDSLPEDDLHIIIAHEFAHMHRHDFLKNLVYELLALPANYHPLLRFTRERIMESREMACDHIAAEIAGPYDYARSLLRVASLLVEAMPIRMPHAIGILDANVFERRLMRLTEKTTRIHVLRGSGRCHLRFGALAAYACRWHRSCCRRQPLAIFRTRERFAGSHGRQSAGGPHTKISRSR
jgi:beta-lactamase regulating signal transducer with metallopeptidase domain